VDNSATEQRKYSKEAHELAEVDPPVSADRSACDDDEQLIRLWLENQCSVHTRRT